MSLRAAAISSTIAVGLGLTACERSPEAKPLPDPPLWAGNRYLGPEAAPPGAKKVFLISYRLTGKAASANGVSVSYGAGPGLPPAGRDFVVELVGADQQILSVRPVTDPRRVIVEHEGASTTPDGVLTLRLGFDRDAAAARLRDSRGRTLAESDLRGAIRAFCREHPRDIDCRTGVPERGGSPQSGRDGGEETPSPPVRPAASGSPDAGGGSEE